jgi:predicted MFS family arabinose efflux permease
MRFRWAERSFPSLTNPQFRLLFLGTSFAQLAFGMMMVVQGVLAFELTGKNSAVGLVSLGMGVTMVSLGPVGGTLSDRLPKRTMLMWAQSIIGGMFALVGFLVLADVIEIWMLVCSTLVMGSMFAVMGPARQAWLGDLLEGERLSNGIALQQVMMNATRILGPLIAGGMLAIAAIGTAGAYLFMAGLFVVVVLLLAVMQPTKPRPRTTVTSIRADVFGGIGYVASTPELRLLALVFVAIVLSGFSYQTIMPGYISNELGHPTSQLGLVYGIAATGGILTTLALAARKPSGDTTALMFGFAAVLACGLLVMAVTPTFLMALGVAAVLGAASSGFQLLNNVNLMQRASPAYFGRVMAVTMMAFGFNSLVAYPIGQFADHVGERMTFGVLAGVCATVVAVGFLAVRARPFAPHRSAGVDVEAARGGLPGKPRA